MRSRLLVEEGFGEGMAGLREAPWHNAPPGWTLEILLAVLGGLLFAALLALLLAWVGRTTGWWSVGGRSQRVFWDS